MTAQKLNGQCGISDPRLSEALLSQQGGTTPGLVPEPALWWPTGRDYVQVDAQNFHFDIGQALTWCQLLGKDPWGANTRIRAIRRGVNAIKGNLEADCERIPGWQAEGRGIFAVPNNGGDTADSITHCGSVFAEWDDRTLAEQYNLPSQLGLPDPTFSVYTGGKSLHSYWVLEEPIGVDRWRLLMMRLIHHCGSDVSVKDPSRCMRLPGAWHIGKDDQVGFWAQLSNITDQRFNADQLEELLPELPKPQRHFSKVIRPSGWTRTLQEIGDALSVIPPRVPGHGTYENWRNIAWGLKAACSDAGYSDEVVVDLLEAHCPSKISGWDVHQVVRSGGDEITAGTFWWHAVQHGYGREPNG